MDNAHNEHVMDSPAANCSNIRYSHCLVFLLLCTGLRLFFMSATPLLAAETYYWEWSRQLAWGYFDHPPMIAFLIRLTTLIGGDSAAWVRLAGFLPGLAGTAALFLLARSMFGMQTALGAAMLMQALPFFAAANVLAVPDAPLACGWLLTVYFVYRATLRDSRNAWYGAGAALGLALLSKYHAFLLMPCTLLFLLLAPEMRFWLRRREPYLACVLALAIFSPNLSWNMANQATTFQFLLVERHGSVSFSPQGGLAFIAGFFVLLSPLFALLVLRLLPEMLSAAFRRHDSRYLFLLSYAVPPVAIFFLLSPLISVGAHWPAVGYPTLCLAALALLMQPLRPGTPAIANSFPRASIVVALVLALLAYLVPAVTASLPPGLRITSRKHTVVPEELYGWQEFGEMLSSTVASMPNPGRTFILTHEYRHASQIRFLTDSRLITRTTGYRPPHQYQLWNSAFNPTGWDAIFVDKKKRGRDIEILAGMFDHVGPSEPLDIKAAGATMRTFYIVRCYGYKKQYQRPAP
jgi:dolichol-phosphate mannosyltransferase